MALKQELETFKAKLPELQSKHEGEFVLIHGRKIHGVFPTYKEAIKAGNEMIGPHTPFFVDWIVPPEQVTLLSPFVATLEKAEKTREEEELMAQIRREHGDPRLYVLKVLGMYPFSSNQT